MDYRKTVSLYESYGLYCHPTKETKSPAMSTNWKNGFELGVFADCYGIGLICGEKSGGIEVIDVDNHGGDAYSNLGIYMAIPEVKEVYERYLFPIEKTVSGGYHLIYRCNKIEGNRKLAYKMLNGVPDCFLETRGEGGYICVDPTPGYKIIRNDLLEVPTISEIDRAILIDNAISMNEVFPTLVKTEYEQKDRPGDAYNDDSSSIGEMISILKGAGWKDVGGFRWRRPGKKEGISATLGKVAPNIFYVFTSNAFPFEPDKAYTPFQVLALIKFNGDFKEAAKSIAPEREAPVKHEKKGPLPVSEIEKILLGARINTNVAVAKPPTILSILNRTGTSYAYNRVFTLGNFSCIIGKAKSKKTFFLSLLSSALLSKPDEGKFVGEMPADKNKILYFDTEQGEYDSYNVIRRIETMSGDRGRLMAYNLRPFAPVERCQIIEHAFKLFGDSIGYCVIDGVADLANGINDEEEASRVTTILLRLSKVHNCHISTVIHQNKNDNFATGHLGSSIMKKSEIIISITKRSESFSEIACDMSRGVGFEPFLMTVNDDGFPETQDITAMPQAPKVDRFESELPTYQSEGYNINIPF